MKSSALSLDLTCASIAKYERVVGGWWLVTDHHLQLSWFYYQNITRLNEVWSALKTFLKNSKVNTSPSICCGNNSIVYNSDAKQSIIVSAQLLIWFRNSVGHISVLRHEAAWQDLDLDLKMFALQCLDEQMTDPWANEKWQCLCSYFCLKNECITPQWFQWFIKGNTSRYQDLYYKSWHLYFL